MNRELNDHLVKILIDTTIFLKFSDESQVNLDVSIQILELMAAELQLMSTKDKLLLIKKIEKISEKYSQPYRDFVKNLSFNFGIAE